VYSTLLATTFILLIILLSNEFVHYLSHAASGKLTAHAVLQLMTLEIPELLGLLLPLGLFIGILLAYGRLYVDSEMTVLFACGISRVRLIMITLSFSAVIMILVAAIMLFVEPKVKWYKDHIYAKVAVAS